MSRLANSFADDFLFSSALQRRLIPSGLTMSGSSYVPVNLPPNAVTYQDIYETRYVTEYLDE